MNNSKEYRCRTKTISGTNYIITLFGENGKPSGYASGYESEEAAQRMIDRFEELGIKASFEEKKWTKKVCIECGEESLLQ